MVTGRRGLGRWPLRPLGVFRDRPPARLVFLAPDDGPEVVYEFYAPFAHIEGRFEWCRIRSPSHGVFNVFIAPGATTAEPATVYVNSVLGQAFMAERYPECTTVRVAPGDLRITDSADGCAVHGILHAEEGPVHDADLELVASPQQVPRQVPYGGTGAPVWGSRYMCWGVDLVLDGKVMGHVRGPALEEEFRGEACLVTVGSFGRIAPR